MTGERHKVARRAVLGAGAAATAVAITGTGAAARTLAPEPASAASTSAPNARRIDYVCRTCGGDSVTRDVWAVWDKAEQDCVLGAAFDYAHCHDCDAETNLIERLVGG